MNPSDARTMVKTVETEHLGDVWLGWVERHYGLARSEMTQVAGGWRVTAHLPEQDGTSPRAAGEPRSLDELAATASSSDVEELAVADLVELLGKLRQGREELAALEDRVLALASEGGASLRALSAALGGGSPEGVRKRLSRLNGRR